MSYTSLDDVDLQDFGIDASSNTDRIKQSLVLSDSAKKFVIANEIHILNSTAWWVDPAILSFLIYIAFVAFLYLHLTKVKKFRIFIDACVLVTCGILYQLGFELYKDLLQTQSDRRTSQMGQKYTEGGIEYLDKLLQRNMLLQAQGDKSYTTSGDRVKSLFSVSKTDFTRRKRVLEQMYQKQLAEAVEKAEVGSDDDEEQDECE